MQKHMLVFPPFSSSFLDVFLGLLSPFLMLGKEEGEVCDYGGIDWPTTRNKQKNKKEIAIAISKIR